MKKEKNEQLAQLLMQLNETEQLMVEDLKKFPFKNSYYINL